MSIDQLISAPWAERDKLAVARAWPEVQKFFGLPDLPHGALYAGMSGEDRPSFKGWNFAAIQDASWDGPDFWDGRLKGSHYARPYRDIIDPPSGSWEEWEEAKATLGNEYWALMDDLTWKHVAKGEYPTPRLCIRRKQAEPIDAAGLLRREAERLNGGASVIEPQPEGSLRWAYLVSAAWLETLDDPARTEKFIPAEKVREFLEKLAEVWCDYPNPPVEVCESTPGFEQFAGIFEEGGDK